MSFEILTKIGGQYAAPLRFAEELSTVATLWTEGANYLAAFKLLEMGAKA